jgi:hypothetical protein
MPGMVAMTPGPTKRRRFPHAEPLPERGFGTIPGGRLQVLLDFLLQLSAQLEIGLIYFWGVLGARLLPMLQGG